MGKIVEISTNVESDQISVKMEYVETSRELISVIVTRDTCEVRMERNVKIRGRGFASLSSRTTCVKLSQRR